MPGVRTPTPAQAAEQGFRYVTPFEQTGNGDVVQEHDDEKADDGDDEDGPKEGGVGESSGMGDSWVEGASEEPLLSGTRTAFDPTPVI